MYSPNSDLYKMIHSPEYIVFRVRIDGKEYLGRPHNIIVDCFFNPGLKQTSDFYTFTSVQSFLSGYISEEIRVTSDRIIGLEAIDTVNQEPLNDILSICNSLENINLNADIGIIYRNIPDLIMQLMDAMMQYEKVHTLRQYQTAYDSFDDLIADCKTFRPDLSPLERSNFIRDIKEKVSFHVTRLIELSAYGLLN